MENAESLNTIQQCSKNESDNKGNVVGGSRQDTKKWDSLLEDIQFIYNTRVNSVTGFAPLDLLMGRRTHTKYTGVDYFKDLFIRIDKMDRTVSENQK